MARHILSKAECAALYKRDTEAFREVRDNSRQIGKSADGADLYELSAIVLRRIADA